MPRNRIAAHLRAARTCNTVLTSLMTYRNRDSAIEHLEQDIREQRIAALVAAEQAAGQTSDRPFTRPNAVGSSARPRQATLRRLSPLFNAWAYGLTVASVLNRRSHSFEPHHT